MKIGIDARMYRSATAGIGRYSQNLIKNLLEIDKVNQYILFMTDEDYREFKNLKSQIPNPKQILNFKIQTTNIPHYSLAEQTKLAGIIEREKCDLVHFLNFNHPIRYQGKFIVTIHDLTLFHFPQAAQKTNFIKRWVYAKIMRQAIKNSAKIIVPSQFTKMDVLKFQKLPPEKIAVIYEAAAPEKIKNQRSKIRKKYNLSQPIILYVGQFRKHKNIPKLLEAYKILKKEINCQLVLVGQVPEEYRQIIDNDADLRDTKMPGFISDEEVAAWYQAASVFVFPSLYEGFGLPGLEAMTAGVPVVSSNRTSLPEVYQDAAIYFDPSNPIEIADKIKMVLKNEKLRQRLIKKGKMVAAKYSWRQTASETLKVYEEIGKRKLENGMEIGD